MFCFDLRPATTGYIVESRDEDTYVESTSLVDINHQQLMRLYLPTYLSF